MCDPSTASRTAPTGLEDSGPVSAEDSATTTITITRKRTADSLSRVAAASAAGKTGRGSQVGWTTCPLCGRHSQKRFAMGRGIASHLHAVHTPWKPGRVELKRRRAEEHRKRNGAKRRKVELNDSLIYDEEVADNEGKGETWEPTQQEIDDWDARVLTILAELEKDADATMLRPGLDRNGNKSQEYLESLPEFLQAASNDDLNTLQDMVHSAKRKDELADLLDVRDRHLSTATHWAAGSGHLDCLRYLVELQGECPAGPDKIQHQKPRRRDGKTCLHYAARNGHLDCIQYLVEDQRHPVDEPSGDGTTPLHLACFGGQLDAVRYLIRHGADLAKTNDWGCGAAHWVALTRSSTSSSDAVDLCKYLYARGASFVQVQRQGHSALHKAAQRQNREVIEWMMQVYGRDCSCAGLPDQGGHTPSEIWLSAGGDAEFGQLMKEQYGW
jgi:ankyrin repeat protein